MPIARIQNAEENVVQFWWHITNVCQYSCSYCPDIAHNGSYKWPPLDNCKRFLDDVFKHFKGKKIRLGFTGGEPTAVPYLGELLDYAKINNPNVHRTIISNGARSSFFWEKFVRHIDDVTLSYHHEFTKHSHFIHICELLGKKLGRINFCIDPNKYDHCMNLYNQLKRIGYPVLAKPLLDSGEFIDRNTKVLINYNAVQKEFINGSNSESIPIKVIRDGQLRNEQVHDIIVNDENTFRGWNCNIGKESISIFFNKVYKSECRQGGPIGNIEKGEWDLSKLTPEVCGFSVCSCISDISISKSA